MPARRRFTPVLRGAEVRGKDMGRRRSVGAETDVGTTRFSALEDQLMQKNEDFAFALVESERRNQLFRERNIVLQDQLAMMREATSDLAGARSGGSEEEPKDWREIALAREAELASSRVQVQDLRSQLAELQGRAGMEQTPRLEQSLVDEILQRMSCSGGSSAEPGSQQEAAMQSSASESDYDRRLLQQELHRACMRLGSQWSQWIHRCAGRRVVIPTWNGCYLSFPKALDSYAAEEDDVAPEPPGSSSWDWPMSRYEKKARAEFISRQMLMADQKSLMEYIEDLQDTCAQHGILASSPFPWDSC